MDFGAVPGVLRSDCSGWVIVVGCAPPAPPSSRLLLRAENGLTFSYTGGSGADVLLSLAAGTGDILMCFGGPC